MQWTCRYGDACSKIGKRTPAQMIATVDSCNGRRHSFPGDDDDDDGHEDPLPESFDHADEERVGGETD